MYTLPKLNFNFDAFEPYIAKDIMEIHYTKHHQTYLNNLNEIIKKYNKNIFEHFSETTLAIYINTFPEDIRQDLKNSLGGHINHTFFWSSLSLENQTEYKEKLTPLFTEYFGSFHNTILKMQEEGKKFFGSGWVWITVNPLNGSLEIRTYKNQDNPLFENLYPLLGIDLWEHAYYLQYKNDKSSYLQNIFNIINWKYIFELYESLVETNNNNIHCCASC